MTALILGHSYYAEENRKQLTEVSRLLDSDLDVVVPRPSGRNGLFNYSVDDIPPGGPGYRFHLVRPYPFADHLRSVVLGLKSCLDRTEPDIVHCEWAPQTVPALQLAMIKRLYSMNFILTGTLRQPVVNFTRRWYAKPLAGITKWLLGEFDGLQISTPLARDAFFEALDIEESSKPSTFVVYQTGIDIEVFHPPDAAERSEARNAFGLSDDEGIVGYCGRFVEEKGITDLVEALRKVRNALMPEAEVRLALMGAGPLEGKIEQVADDYGVPVSFFPVRPHVAVVQFMWALDVFTLPSRVREDWVEHDAHVVVEAMACGIPVVATMSGATPDVLSDAGCLVPPGEPTALAEEITKILSNDETAHRLATSGRQEVFERFSHEAVATKMVAAWNKLTGSHG